MASASCRLARLFRRDVTGPFNCLNIPQSDESLASNEHGWQLTFSHPPTDCFNTLMPPLGKLCRIQIHFRPIMFRHF